MDRLSRTLAACGLGLGLLTAASGCRATRTEVPPGRPVDASGRQRKAIDFSTEGHPVSGEATTNLMPNNMGGSNLAQGIGSNAKAMNPAAFGAPTASFGRPGTSGLGNAQPPSVTEAPTAPADLPPPIAAPPVDPGLNPSRTPEPGSAPNPIVIPPMETGTMGQPGQMPPPM